MIFFPSIDVDSDESATQQQQIHQNKSSERHLAPRNQHHVPVVSSSPNKRPADKCAHTRDLRERHVTSNTQDMSQIHMSHVTNLSQDLSQIHNLSHVTNLSQDLEHLQLNKDAFEVLVEKYVTEKTPLHVETGRVSNTRSIFENHQI